MTAGGGLIHTQGVTEGARWLIGTVGGAGMRARGARVAPEGVRMKANKPSKGFVTIAGVAAAAAGIGLPAQASTGPHTISLWQVTTIAMAGLLTAGLLTRLWRRQAARPARQEAVSAPRAGGAAAQRAAPGHAAAPSGVAAAPGNHFSREVRGKDILIRYADSRGEHSERRVTIREVLCTEQEGRVSALSVEGFCHVKKARRSFIVARMESIADPTTGEVITDLPAFLHLRAPHH